MQPEQPLIAPTLMGRGGDTALGMEQRSPEQRPPSAASPRAAVQVVMLQPLLAAASVPLYAGPIQWMGQLAGPISGFVGGGTLPLPRAVGIGRPDGGGRGGGVGPVRARKTKRMDRRLTHWQCSYCRHETPNDSRSTKCGHCGEAKAQLRDADANGREAARRAQRAKEYQGRSLNALGVGTASVPRAAQGVFERTRADALVRWETEQLEQYTGAASYLRREDCVLGVIESFFIVQTGARVSVIDECKRSCITETDVARLFNAVGRRVATGVPGEDTFPMGGYFNEFRREGVSVELVRELRTVVTGAIAAIGGDVSAITASANSFRKWYSDAQNATAVALLGRGGAVNIAIMRAAKQLFARWYCPGEITTHTRPTTKNTRDVTGRSCTLTERETQRNQQFARHTKQPPKAEPLRRRMSAPGRNVSQWFSVHSRAAQVKRSSNCTLGDRRRGERSTRATGPPQQGT